MLNIILDANLSPKGSGTELAEFIGMFKLERILFRCGVNKKKMWG